MTTLTVNIKDDSKVEDVYRFLADIDFLEVSRPTKTSTKKPRVPGLLKNRIRMSPDFDDELPNSFWNGES